jgi:hypothetical protein
MIYHLPKDTDKFKAAFDKLIEYAGRVELKKLFPKRSLNQNNYLHLILSHFGIEFGYTLNEVKQIYKDVNSEIYSYQKNEKTFYRSSAEPDTKEMTQSIEKFRDYSAENGCYLPAPDEQHFLDHIRNEIEKHKQWL